MASTKFNVVGGLVFLVGSLIWIVGSNISFAYFIMLESCLPLGAGYYLQFGERKRSLETQSK